MRRRFNASERVALHALAGGQCEACGAQLLPSWHADHVYPASKGGPTDVTNGAALCPPCNLKKGDTVSDLRPWQQEALDNLSIHTETDFLAVATPGAGKTRFALAAMKQDPSFYIVVVPSTPLRRQWADAAGQADVDLDPTFENGNIRPSPECDGIVVTYAAVASMPAVYRNLCARRRTFVVLDEIHHCGDDLTWGTSIRQAFEPATRRLLMSGTPFRGDNTAIPFVPYEGDPPTSRPHYRYDYGSALFDGVVRAIEFSFYDGTAHWMGAGKMISIGLSDVERDDEGNALSSALMPASGWMDVVLPEADRTLRRIRRDIPDAGGLLIAKDQLHAQRMAQRLSAVTKESTPVAISDDPHARDVIEAFAASTAPWLVAVNMVSEGVDIPRLMVGVYATTSRTDLFFRQAVGRFVRVRGNESDSCAATLFLPSISRFIELAKDLEDERDHVINDDGEPRERSTQDRQLALDINEPLAATDGRYAGSILNGSQISDVEYQQASEAVERHGLNWNPAKLALILREIGIPSVDDKPVVPARAKYLERGRLKAEVGRLVKKYAALRDVEHAKVWRALHDQVGEKSLKDATTESLERRLLVLSEWLS